MTAMYKPRKATGLTFLIISNKYFFNMFYQVALSFINILAYMSILKIFLSAHKNCKSAPHFDSSSIRRTPLQETVLLII